MSSSEEIIKNLRKSNPDSLPNVEEAGVINRLILDSPQLNYIFGGGFPLGRIIEFYGPEGGSKTSISSKIGGNFQRRTDKPLQNKVLFIDMEYTFDKEYGKVAGLDTSPENFIFLRPLNGEEAFTIAEELIKTGELGLIIWDSVAATASASQMTDEYGKRSFGGGAVVFAEGLKKLNPYISRYQTSLILVNQVRAKIGGFQGGFGPQESTPGGYAIKFYASWRGRVSRGEPIMDKKETIGTQVNVKNVKSKVGFPKRSALLDLYYATGFSTEQEYIDFVVNLGIVERKGAWFSNAEWGFKGQGKDSILDFLRADPILFTKVKEQVNMSFSKKSILDEQEIQDEVAEAEIKILDADDI